MNEAYPGLRSRCSLQPGLVQDGLSALRGETNQSGSCRAGFRPSEAALIDALQFCQLLLTQDTSSLRFPEVACG
jgi:hypothetical protein